MRSYKETIEQRRRKYEEKFSDKSLNKSFIPYYENQERITVDFGYEKKRGTIGITTGWVPCFLLMLRKDSRGSSYTIGENDRVV